MLLMGVLMACAADGSADACCVVLMGVLMVCAANWSAEGVCY